MIDMSLGRHEGNKHRDHEEEDIREAHGLELTICMLLKLDCRVKADRVRWQRPQHKRLNFPRFVLAEIRQVRICLPHVESYLQPSHTARVLFSPNICAASILHDKVLTP